MNNVPNIVYTVLGLLLLGIIITLSAANALSVELPAVIVIDSPPDGAAGSGPEYHDQEDGAPGRGDFYIVKSEGDIEREMARRFDYRAKSREITYDDFFTVKDYENLKLELEVYSVEYLNSYTGWGEFTDTKAREAYQLVGFDSTGAPWKVAISRYHIEQTPPTEIVEYEDTITVYGHISGWRSSTGRVEINGQRVDAQDINARYIETAEDIFNYNRLGE